MKCDRCSADVKDTFSDYRREPKSGKRKNVSLCGSCYVHLDSWWHPPLSEQGGVKGEEEVEEELRDKHRENRKKQNDHDLEVIRRTVATKMYLAMIGGKYPLPGLHTDDEIFALCLDNAREMWPDSVRVVRPVVACRL